MRVATLACCLAAASAVPHVLDGYYDKTWLPEPVSSAATITDALVTNPNQSWLVAVVDDADPTCLGSYDSVLLRNAQRRVASRYMRIAVAKKSDWSGTWPSLGCGVMLVKKGQTLEEPEDKHALLPDAPAENRHAVSGIAERGAKINMFTLTNNLDHPVAVMWFDINLEEGVDDNNDEEEPFLPVAELEPGQSTTIRTTLGHVFAVKQDGAFVGFVTAEHQDQVALLDAQLVADATTCANAPHDPHAAKFHAARLASLESEGGDRVRFALLEHVYNLAMEKRLALSDVQSQITPNVTADGFKMVRVDDVYKKVREWYDANHAELKEIEGDGGPLYNQRDVPTWHTPLPPKLKRWVFDELKPVMEEWAPTTAPLKGTSAYGVRTYENGSYLHLHVDTADTHVVSGILNVAQKVRKPWPVEILDHDGRHHAVEMQPGDLLLYESAKLLHGRPQPLDGDMYANVFVHYKPTTGWHVDF